MYFAVVQFWSNGCRKLVYFPTLPSGFQRNEKHICFQLRIPQNNVEEYNIKSVYVFSPFATNSPCVYAKLCTDTRIGAQSTKREMGNMEDMEI